jgi:hypothetical protein
MKNLLTLVTIACGMVVMAAGAQAASVSEREYRRGYNDCLVGNYDQNQHGASYKRGCRAAETSGKGTGHTQKDKADPAYMKSACNGAVHGRFGSYLMSMNMGKAEHQNHGWALNGTAVMDNGGVSNFTCMFSSTGTLKGINASDPDAGFQEMDHEGYCPPDVSEANRYQFPGCN